MKSNKNTPQLILLKTELDGMLNAGKELLVYLEQAKPKPYVLDNKTIQHMKRVYTKQQTVIKEYQNLLIRLSDDEPSNQQISAGCEATINDILDIHKQVFFLIDFFKEHTIEKILMKDDIELVNDWITNKIFPP